MVNEAIEYGLEEVTDSQKKGVKKRVDVTEAAYPGYLLTHFRYVQSLVPFLLFLLMLLIGLFQRGTLEERETVGPSSITRRMDTVVPRIVVDQLIWMDG